MSDLHAIILALLQGLTEFLPVSSSAHLILPSQLLGWPDQGIAFDAIDNQPVDILFALLVPESECKTHLKTLSLIASKLNDKAFCRLLRQAESDEALYQLMIAP